MRYELSDYEWTAIKPMLPNKPRGVRRVNDRRVLNGIFWVLRSGAPWRDHMRYLSGKSKFAPAGTIEKDCGSSPHRRGTLTKGPALAETAVPATRFFL